MARMNEAQCRQCRRAGQKLFLKGDKCLGAKCTVIKRNYPPGQHGVSGSRKASAYAIALKEKQKVKRMYGVLERQFRNYYQSADRKEGVTGTILLQFLEKRLDNVVYRLGFGSSRRLARQLVNHGHLTVNGKKVDIPSYQVKKGDVIEVSPHSAKHTYFTDIAKDMLEKAEVPGWLKIDKKKMVGEVAEEPQREDVDSSIQESLIVELYSK
ncbi:TPA: 30S ribosomal protein S4 [candidate division CPR2 bacterium]|uniref:Small ribosomal subunit protein uS4 n=1 Tax=candidate division CPR2 bacterium GW2011_GWC1_41_48 TaxID=1618344 RepID=A0A0G0W793_UNCC2|nr:MAG: 30S ribosomal protein S4 A [candidate division CPR2 bacterium GW2011_GWC2_39_35]KKR27173.1 MAG: 30S ribosomal protein S4 A [candidate division CPR2 bacterium GW2011_GWD2_39_7]KKR29183.1 MAG: 30S ribosomal protein S4 A [candidate division CPR2 bacterium GW2011_GWD1_39_7]KKS08859.1 MAG: 30S ribosomal protein S4 A [candidate division CPR2 bacterium GW2011_GWC1_41_48]OGB62163.1 MAG: 30S ribosomal protein S4 [candidate division CPR2 bacterium GWD1_39_7]OGB70322.1 MAG: 30S ribosomal protein 